MRAEIRRLKCSWNWAAFETYEFQCEFCRGAIQILAAFQLDKIRATTRKLKHVAQMSAQMQLNMSLDWQLDKIRNWNSQAQN